MGVVRSGLKLNQIFSLVGLIVAIGIADAKDEIPRGDIDPTIGVCRQVHRLASSGKERLNAIGASIAVGVFQHANAIGLGTFIRFGAKMGVAFDRKHASLGINRQSGHSDD